MNRLSVRLRGLASGALLALGGCAFGNLFTPPPPGQQGAAPGPNAPHAPGQPAWQGPSPGAGAAQGTGPAGVQQASYPGAFNEQLSSLTQQLRASDDERKVWSARVKQLEGQLRDKDRALSQATFEIQEATAQVTKTREELQRWKQELEAVRGKLRSAERDNKTTLEAIIRTLEQFLERERDNAPALEISPSSLN
jgi:hypothetical protein